LHHRTILRYLPGVIATITVSTSQPQARFDPHASDAPFLEKRVRACDLRTLEPRGGTPSQVSERDDRVDAARALCWNEARDDGSH
jgi:hypothetical protein